MLKRLTTTVIKFTSKLLNQLTTTKLVAMPIAACRQFAQRHVELMTTGAAYRGQIAAAAAALVALTDLPTPWATLVLALVAIYVATFTPNNGGWFTSSLASPYDLDEERW